ncbi:MAG: chorismate mutase [Bacteroidales bacterium]|nr:chorismate mutase [Bacteroidales bacterium]
MNALEEARLGIREADSELSRLFEKRMRLVEKVLDYKVRHGLPVLDAAQEARVLAAHADELQEPVLQEYYILLLKKLMELSRAYQTRLMQGMKIAYCGVPGAFAHIAARRLFPEAETVPYPDFSLAYRACENGEADATLLPVENSYAGDVGAVMDLAFAGHLHINAMAALDVTQHLLGIKGAKSQDIRTVVSHPQALAQCAAFIRERKLSEQEFGNTAAAAQYVAERQDPTLAAIASLETAQLYGLDVLEKHINTAAANTTRFAVFSRNQPGSAPAASPDDHFILAFTVRNEAGALAKILNIIGAHGFNMSCLHSRPVAGPLWNHYFFAELEGNAHTENGQDLLRQMETVCDRLRCLGSYKCLALS